LLFTNFLSKHGRWQASKIYPGILILPMVPLLTPPTRNIDRVPHPSRFLRRVGYHGSAPKTLPRTFCLSHPSQKARRMGHPIIATRAMTPLLATLLVSD
jgi:hypothetical protein